MTPDGDVKQLAVVRLDSDAVVEAIDGQIVDSRPTGGRVEPTRELIVSPGHHEITANMLRFFRPKYGFGQSGYNEGANAQSLKHTFVAGHRYKLLIVEPEYNRTWRPELFDLNLGKVVARPDTETVFARPSRAPKPGTGGITGVAAVAVKRTVYTAVGRPVELVPKSRDADAWVEGMNRNKTSGRLVDPEGTYYFDSMPLSVKKARRIVHGFGSGQFEFMDLPPGDYYVYFYAEGVSASVTVTVSADRVTQFVKCLGEMPKSIPDAPPRQ